MSNFKELKIPLEEDEAKKMMKICDVDGDGKFNFTEFLKTMMYNVNDTTLDPSIYEKWVVLVGKLQV